MFFIAYAFKGQIHVFAGGVKIISHSSCRTSAILKYFCPLGTKKTPLYKHTKQMLKLIHVDKQEFTILCSKLIEAGKQLNYYFIGK